MGDNAVDPRVADRSLGPRSDKAPATAAKTPGLVLTGLAAVSLVVCLTCFATRQTDAGVSAASIALLALGAVLSWLTTESRRVRDVQRR